MLATFQAKKLVLVMMTPSSMTVASIKTVPLVSDIDKSIVILSFKPLSFIVNNLALPLKRIPYIHYLMWLKKDLVKIQVLLNSGNKVNTMTLAYTAKISLKV